MLCLTAEKSLNEDLLSCAPGVDLHSEQHLKDDDE